MSPSLKPIPDFSVEKALGLGSQHKWVIGVDEVGRGCLAGPVVAGAILWSHEQSQNFPKSFSEIRDSKLLKESVRESLKPQIESFVQAYSVQEASVEEIDAINILQASHVAMVRAVQNLLLSSRQLIGQQDSVLILIDGNLLPQGLKKLTESENILLAPHAVVKGDQKSMVVASASILAKVYRDHLMQKLHEQYPRYGLAQHKGYPTPFHKKAILEFGAAPIHRRSFLKKILR